MMNYINYLIASIEYQLNPISLVEAISTNQFHIAKYIIKNKLPVFLDKKIPFTAEQKFNYLKLVVPYLDICYKLCKEDSIDDKECLEMLKLLVVKGNNIRHESIYMASVKNKKKTLNFLMKHASIDIHDMKYTRNRTIFDNPVHIVPYLLSIYGKERRDVIKILVYNGAKYQICVNQPKSYNGAKYQICVNKLMCLNCKKRDKIMSEIVNEITQELTNVLENYTNKDCISKIINFIIDNPPYVYFCPHLSSNRIVFL